MIIKNISITEIEDEILLPNGVVIDRDLNDL